MKGILVFLAIIVLAQAVSFGGAHRRRHGPLHAQKDGIDLGDFAKIAGQLQENAAEVVQQAKDVFVDVIEQSKETASRFNQEEKGTQNGYETRHHDGESTKEYAPKEQEHHTDGEGEETRHHGREGCHRRRHHDEGMEGKEEERRHHASSWRHHEDGEREEESHHRGGEKGEDHHEGKGEGHEGWRHHDEEGSRHHRRRHQRHHGWGGHHDDKAWGHHSRWGRHHDMEDKEEGHEGWTFEDRMNFFRTFTSFRLESGLPAQTYNILSDQGIQVRAVYGDCAGENRTVVQKVMAKVMDKTIEIDQDGTLHIDGSKYDVDGKFAMTWDEVEVKVLHRGAILIKQGPYRLFVKPKSYGCASLRTSIAVAKNATVSPTGYLGQRMAVNPKDHIVAV